MSSQLRRQIITYFNIDELQSLVFELDIDYESLEGNTKNEKVVSLLEYCEHRDRNEDLVTKLQQARPSVAWDIPNETYFEEANSSSDLIVNSVQLSRILAKSFTLGEIESLCFDLNYSFEELGEGGRTAKAIRLVKHFERADRLNELAEVVLRERPSITVQELGREAFSDGNQIPGEAPYKGLAYFDVDDADQFYGREAQTTELLEHLLREQFLAVVGASGSGKSSLIRAGLIPALQGNKVLQADQYLPDDCHSWPVHIITPTNDPLLSLATEFADSVDQAVSLRQNLAAQPDRLKLTIQFLLKENQAKRLFLFVDQFEEVFTQCKEPDVRQAFIDNLINAAKGTAVVVIALRADFYAACANYDNLRELLSHQQVYLGPMSREELRQSIEQPAFRYDWKFEEGLVDLMLEDVGATETRHPEPGALPLLSHALLETWKHREGAEMTLVGYIRTGGIRGAIAQTAENVYQKRLRAEQQDVARRIFLRLTEIGEAQDTRRRAQYNELITNEHDGKIVDAVLLVLTDARLIVVDANADGNEKIIQVTHEALIREWPLLREWLDESRDSLRIHRQITTDTLTWQRSENDPDLLYRGARLTRAIVWLDENPKMASQFEREYVENGRFAAEEATRLREEEQQRKLEMAEDLATTQTQAAKRLRWMIAAMGLGLLAVLVVVGILLVPVLQNEWAKNQALALGDMIVIEGGEMLYGTVILEHQELGLSPQQPIYVDAFQMDKYEVSNRQYHLCVEYGDCTAPLDQKFAQKNPNDPVVFVTLLQANAYCHWLNLRLPTEVEWERAARGPNNYLWPWGDELPNPTLANMPFDEYKPENVSAVNDFSNGKSHSEEVYNLVGNVWEWTTSYGDGEGHYENLFWDGKEIFDNEDAVVQRGGGWTTEIDDISEWNPAFALQVDAETGFRCARGFD